MKNLTSIFILIALSITLSGCPSTPTRQEVLSYNYGDRPEDGSAHNAIVSFMTQRLIDPESARYSCGTPKKGSAWSCEHPGVKGCGTRFGYIVYCKINAKNRMGGYTGAKEHYFMLKGDIKNLFAYDLEIHPNWIDVYE